MITITKPAEKEFSPHVKPYIQLLPDDGEVLQHLQNHYDELKKLVQPLNKKQLHYRYDEGKWDIKEILLHLADSERIFAVRALHIARGDKTDLPGFDQEDYVSMCRADARTIDSIFDEFDTVRAATLSLFNSFNHKQLKRMGSADGTPVSVRALIYMAAGHQKHHINTIRERYLNK